MEAVRVRQIRRVYGLLAVFKLHPDDRSSWLISSFAKNTKVFTCSNIDNMNITINLPYETIVYTEEEQQEDTSWLS